RGRLDDATLLHGRDDALGRPAAALRPRPRARGALARLRPPLRPHRRGMARTTPPEPCRNRARPPPRPRRGAARHPPPPRRPMGISRWERVARLPLPVREARVLDRFRSCDEITVQAADSETLAERLQRSRTREHEPRLARESPQPSRFGLEP